MSVFAVSSVSIALPEDLQLQSPLVRLPMEAKHILFSYWFAADGPMVDLVVGCSRPQGKINPKLGVNILQTSRRLYHKIDRRPLMSQNTFRFTTVHRVRCFFLSIGKASSECVLDIEIDARRVQSVHPGIRREWLQYLAWGGDTWSKFLGSLRVDAPGLRCLRLNFESWPSISMFRTELWNLEEHAVTYRWTGKSRRHWGKLRERHGYARTLVTCAFRWADDVGSDDLMQRMWTNVKKSDELVKHVDKHWAGPSTRENTDAWPEKGSCTWLEYQNRNELTTKGINPSAAG